MAGRLQRLCVPAFMSFWGGGAPAGRPRFRCLCAAPRSCRAHRNYAWYGFRPAPLPAAGACLAARGWNPSDLTPAACCSLSRRMNASCSGRWSRRWIAPDCWRWWAVCPGWSGITALLLRGGCRCARYVADRGFFWRAAPNFARPLRPRPAGGWSRRRAHPPASSGVALNCPVREAGA